MRISARLNLISAGTLAGLVLLVLAVGWSFAGFRAAEAHNALAIAMQVAQFEKVSYRDQYLLYREDRHRELWFQCDREAAELGRQAREQFRRPEDLEILELIRVNGEASTAIFKRIVANTAALAGAGGNRPILEELDKRLASQLFLKAAEVRKATTALAQASEARVEQAYRRLSLVVGLFALSSALATLLTSRQIVRLLRERLKPLHAGVQTVAGGDLSFRLEAGGQDEFSDLARAFNGMTEQLQVFTRKHEEEESERKLTAILEGVDACIYLKDARGRYLFANRPQCALLGRPREEVLGRDDGAFFTGETLARLREHDRQVLEEGRTVRLEETLVNRLDGSATAYWSVKHPVRDPAGAIYAMCGVATDLSERKELEAKLYQAQKMQSLGLLAGGVAHDMNNVLAAIVGLASAHLTLHPPQSPAYQAFDTIVTAALRGGAMVKRLLGFSRQTPAENTLLDLNELVREQVRLLEHTTLARVALNLDLDPALWPIRGDGGALSHAVMNLCVNAVDALPDHGTLLLRTRNREGGQVELAVVDDGAGMAQEVLDRALDPFFTTKGQGKGTGLGLSLVYSTVTAHKGQLSLHSEPGRGTTVLLRFPAAVAAGPPAREPAPAPSGAVLAILLVDDDDLVRGACEGLLEVLGHRVTVAASGEEALLKLEAGLQADLVIMDLNMPGLGGAGTLPRLRALRPALPVLLATGRADQTALALLAVDPQTQLLAKPFTLEELREGLSAGCAGRPG